MVSGFPLKHAMASTERHVCHVQKKIFNPCQPGVDQCSRKTASEAGARLRPDTLTQILLHLDSAAATDDLIRIGAGAPGLVGLIFSLP